MCREAVDIQEAWEPKGKVFEVEGSFTLHDSSEGEIEVLEKMDTIQSIDKVIKHLESLKDNVKHVSLMDVETMIGKGVLILYELK